ncbi:hypothetical protein MRY87_07370 [bacterium]|nr:hypothetical protein [bacterium]
MALTDEALSHGGGDTGARLRVGFATTVLGLFSFGCRSFDDTLDGWPAGLRFVDPTVRQISEGPNGLDLLRENAALVEGEGSSVETGEERDPVWRKVRKRQEALGIPEKSIDGLVGLIDHCHAAVEDALASGRDGQAIQGEILQGLREGSGAEVLRESFGVDGNDPTVKWWLSRHLLPNIIPAAIAFRDSGATQNAAWLHMSTHGPALLPPVIRGEGDLQGEETGAYSGARDGGVTEDSGIAEDSGAGGDGRSAEPSLEGLSIPELQERTGLSPVQIAALERFFEYNWEVVSEGGKPQALLTKLLGIWVGGEEPAESFRRDIGLRRRDPLGSVWLNAHVTDSVAEMSLAEDLDSARIELWKKCVECRPAPSIVAKARSDKQEEERVAESERSLVGEEEDESAQPSELVEVPELVVSSEQGEDAASSELSESEAGVISVPLAVPAPDPEVAVIDPVTPASVRGWGFSQVLLGVGVGAAALQFFRGSRSVGEQQSGKVRDSSPEKDLGTIVKEALAVRRPGVFTRAVHGLRRWCGRPVSDAFLESEDTLRETVSRLAREGQHGEVGDLLLGVGSPLRRGSSFERKQLSRLLGHTLQYFSADSLAQVFVERARGDGSLSAIREGQQKLQELGMLSSSLAGATLTARRELGVDQMEAMIFESSEAPRQVMRDVRRVRRELRLSKDHYRQAVARGVTRRLATVEVGDAGDDTLLLARHAVKHVLRGDSRALVELRLKHVAANYAATLLTDTSAPFLEVARVRDVVRRNKADKGVIAEAVYQRFQELRSAAFEERDEVALLRLQQLSRFSFGGVFSFSREWSRVRKAIRHALRDSERQT